jgi:hypothetical protein
MAICVQVLRCIKLKYLLFFSAEWVCRYLGRDAGHGEEKKQNESRRRKSKTDKPDQHDQSVKWWPSKPKREQVLE